MRADVPTAPPRAPVHLLLFSILFPTPLVPLSLLLSSAETSDFQAEESSFVQFFSQSLKLFSSLRRTTA
eukprot:m.259923 g.259923  ORF g.259923 m.259923 type:complete len:69 (-) comp54588_c0_seq4:1037-1243(-)